MQISKVHYLNWNSKTEPVHFGNKLVLLALIHWLLMGSQQSFEHKKLIQHSIAHMISLLISLNWSFFVLV